MKCPHCGENVQSKEMQELENWVFRLVRDVSIKSAKINRKKIPALAEIYVRNYFKEYEERIWRANGKDLRDIMQEIVDTEIKVNDDLVKLVDKEKYRLIGIIYDKLGG